MEANRKLWNQRQKELRHLLSSSGQHDAAIKLILSQHAAHHAAEMSPSPSWSFQDEVLAGLTANQIRRVPHNCEHSIAWILWHIARIEDVTMNLLVAGESQLLHQESWLGRIGINIQETGNGMNREAVVDFSNRIDVVALRAYRLAVGRRTREIVQELTPEALRQRVDPARLERVMEEGALVEAARDILEYWGRRDIAGLLLMPATRHPFLHLNEASRLKKRRQ